MNQQGMDTKTGAPVKYNAVAAQEEIMLQMLFDSIF